MHKKKEVQILYKIKKLFLLFRDQLTLKKGQKGNTIENKTQETKKIESIEYVITKIKVKTNRKTIIKMKNPTVGAKYPKENIAIIVFNFKIYIGRYSRSYSINLGQYILTKLESFIISFIK
ncbi:hypothetical protein RFI_34149 [Reticulomyxa filosa]|uniref:Uncharacterized protein n=1 Tax=Reticulomyxa filosa TaxID=46433 RepID=X6LPF8_RETFI|nr:hypothetical protein RFI_34149 [Reticulomyxa filosa]|eukprot:ETO03261.1 hypothetical protein RFI_34149 [Reticulomyxa filosa]